MNYKILLIFLLSILIIGCEQNLKESNKSQFKIEKKYKNIGFALIYENDIKKIKKIDDRSLLIHHKFYLLPFLKLHHHMDRYFPNLMSS